MPIDGVMPTVNIKQRIHILGRAISHFRKENYEGFYSSLFNIQKEGAKKFDDNRDFIRLCNQKDFEIRWLVTETFRSGNFGPLLNHTYPLLTVSCQMVGALNLIVYRSCPYIVNIHSLGTHLMDNDLNLMTLNTKAIPDIIFQSIKIR